MGEPTLRRFARRVAKGAWWAVTPWRTPERVRFMRERAAADARTAETAALVAREEARVAWRRGGKPVPAPAPLDLFEDGDVVAAVGLDDGSSLFLPPLAPEAIVDVGSAARFCIDLWRRRPDLRLRFPVGLSSNRTGAFGRWLEAGGGAELKLADAAVEQVLALLESGFSDRARQAFITHPIVCAALPHGLTPAGMRDLFRWFMRCALIDSQLQAEEVWWLFLQAAEHPARELAQAYCFAPAWQQAQPEGKTVFGRVAFADWFKAEYGASGPWTDPSRWPDWQAPDTQIRIAYWARPAWREAHPLALREVGAAGGLLDWLASPAASLPDALRQWVRGLDREHTSAALASPGINIIGHFCYPSGLRVSAESIVEAVRSVGGSVSLRDVATDVKDDPRHVDFRGMETHEVTVIHTQPEPFFSDAFARANLFERTPRTYRVAYWYWEFNSIPDAWLTHAREVDEVWAATEFVAKGLRDKLPVPVRTLFPGVKLAPYERRPKRYFGLDEAPFTFLFTFHMMSVMERKNPLGLIRAFRQAFQGEEEVRLVLKTSFGDRHPDQFKALSEAAAGARITLIDQVYSPDEVLSLMDACDAYVSLHRSEGLGLTMAEAMLMGKPVIATNFSGNVDFMNADNSLLVDYELVKVGRPIPPYDADLDWAEPSIDHAASLMRRVFENQAWAREIGAHGKASAEANLSLQAAGRRIVRRLDEIRSRPLLP